MNKTKLRKLKQAARLKHQQELKAERIQQTKKLVMLSKRKERKLNKPNESKKFFDDYFSSMKEEQNSNIEIPSLITDQWGKCTKKKSPLDD